MHGRGRYRPLVRCVRPRRVAASVRTPIACLAAVVVIAGCTTVVDGRALSILNDPFRVGGLPATNGPSGARPDAPAASGTVINTNNGAIDKLSLLSVNDIEDYWMAVYSESLKGTFRPVGKLVSYDSNDPSSPIVCHIDTYQLVNAFFSSRCNLIAWDRGVFMAVAQEYFGDMSVNGVLAHEFGHALQVMANLVTRKDPTIVREQQADCFAGVYLWCRRHCDPRQVLGTDAFRLSRRMDRIGEQRQHVDRCLPGRHHHGRLPTAVGMSPGDQRTLGKAAAQLDRFDDAGTVA